MKACLRFSLTFTFIACGLFLDAHGPADNGVTYLKENRHPQERALLNIPDIDGYITLKCDFHMHTIFSDGLVWPTIRIQEAWQEGLDAVAITDHLEYHRYKEDIPINLTRSYEVAQSAADEANILLVNGSEVTRPTPPGHFNAIFIKNAEELFLPTDEGNFEQDKKAVELAAGQGAFIFWNHPGWRVKNIEGSYEWLPLVDQLNKEGNLHGIEVINGFSFYRKALDWALEHNLTVMGTSDIHGIVSHTYDMERGASRTMTLVFAEEHSPEGIREALDAGRTVAWASKTMAGRETWIRALYDASVHVSKPHGMDGRGKILSEMTNISDFSFEFERVDPDLDGWPETISLNPCTTQILKVESDSGKRSARYVVTNAHIGGNRNLMVEISL